MFLTCSPRVNDSSVKLGNKFVKLKCSTVQACFIKIWTGFTYAISWISKKFLKSRWSWIGNHANLSRFLPCQKVQAACSAKWYKCIYETHASCVPSCRSQSMGNCLSLLGRDKSQPPQIFNGTIDWVYARYRRLMFSLDQPWLQRSDIERCIFLLSLNRPP